MYINNMDVYYVEQVKNGQLSVRLTLQQWRSWREAGQAVCISTNPKVKELTEVKGEILSC